MFCTVRKKGFEHAFLSIYLLRLPCAALFYSIVLCYILF